MVIHMESQLAHFPTETSVEQNSIPKENGKMNNVGGLNDPTKFGLRENAVDEWPEKRRVHSFYIVKYRRLEDQKLKSKFEQAEIELQKKNKARSEIIEKLKARRADRSQLIEQRKSLSADNQQFWTKIDNKRKEVKPLQDALGELRGARNTGGERGYRLCSSEEELNNLIKSLQYHIQHESIPLNEEKQIVREIKQLEGTREDVKRIAAKGDKESIQNQVKLMSVDLDGVRKEQQAVKAKLKILDEHIDDVTKQIKSLDEELKEIVQKIESTYKHILELRKQRDEGNSPFYKNTTMLQTAKQLADKKDIEALKEISTTEVEKFMSLWSVNKPFRDDYERRVLMSLDIRQLSRDGRVKNSNEKPLVLPEAPTVSQTEVIAPRTNADPPKEEPVCTAQLDASVKEKVQKEENSEQLKDANGKNTSTIKEDFRDDGGAEEVGLGKLPEDTNAEEKEVDEEKFREMKREEEIAKYRMAMERKKKLNERAAAKAAIKTQKEAEKKLKDLDKKAKKKSGAVVSGQDPTEEPNETAEEEEKAEEKVETPVARKVKERKETNVRHRAIRAKGSELPKVILKRKKGTNYYWQWAAPAALVMLLLLVAGYKYMY